MDEVIQNFKEKFLPGLREQTSKQRNGQVKKGPDNFLRQVSIVEKIQRKHILMDLGRICESYLVYVKNLKTRWRNRQ